ncbi:hypothetical protein DFH06DRAFT_124637 [Mycena polygramma]|nr:hypothetical protein DFH06DRAFT_124637 [Mycena polygramma]
MRTARMRCDAMRERETLLRSRSTTQVLTADTERELNIHLSHAAPILRHRPPRPPLLCRRTGVRLRVYAFKLPTCRGASCEGCVTTQVLALLLRLRLRLEERQSALRSLVLPSPGCRTPPAHRPSGLRSRCACIRKFPSGRMYAASWEERTATTFQGTSLPLARDVRTAIRLDERGGHLRRVPGAIAMEKCGGEVFSQRKGDPLLHPSFALPPIVLRVEWCPPAAVRQGAGRSGDASCTEVRHRWGR